MIETRELMQGCIRKSKSEAKMISETGRVGERRRREEEEGSSWREEGRREFKGESHTISLHMYDRVCVQKGEVLIKEANSRCVF